jgi:hypothetical protein
MDHNNRQIHNLLRNHAEFERFDLHLDEFTSASLRECAEALVWNTSCRKGVLTNSAFGAPHTPTEEEEWVPFWNAISNLASLLHIALYRGSRHSDRFLEAISGSASIETVAMFDTNVNADSFSRFLRSTTSVKRLILNRMGFKNALNPEEAAMKLSEAIAVNTSIETVSCSRWEAVYQAAIFRGLARHTRVKMLQLANEHANEDGGTEFTLEEATALQLALTATLAPLQTLDFCCLNFTEAWFSVVVQGIQGSRSITHVSFQRCSFDEGSTRLLQELFTRPSDKCYVLYVRGIDTLALTADAFFRDTLTSNACLSILSLQDSNDELVTAVATALKNDSNSVLKSLFVSITVYSQFQVLVGCLPKMKHLRTLDITLRGTNVLGCNAMLLQALKRNSSLWHVTADLEEDRSEADTAAMQFYARRNKKIHAVLTAPTNSVQALLTRWPRIFLCIRGCEMEASIILFVLTVLGKSVGPQDSETTILESLGEVGRIGTKPKIRLCRLWNAIKTCGQKK